MNVQTDHQRQGRRDKDTDTDRQMRSNAGSMSVEFTAVKPICLAEKSIPDESASLLDGRKARKTEEDRKR